MIWIKMRRGVRWWGGGGRKEKVGGKVLRGWKRENEGGNGKYQRTTSLSSRTIPLTTKIYQPISTVSTTWAPALIDIRTKNNVKDTLQQCLEPFY